jgi:hypothetical protein
MLYCSLLFFFFPTLIYIQRVNLLYDKEECLEIPGCQLVYTFLQELGWD